MGRNHARVYTEMLAAQLVGVADQDLKAATAIAERLGCRGYENHQELLEREKPDAVTVAVPTHAHASVVKDALKAGCHVLVEKPIAETLEEAD